MQHGLKGGEDYAGSKESQRGKWKWDKIEEMKLSTGVNLL